VRPPLLRLRESNGSVEVGASLRVMVCVGFGICPFDESGADGADQCRVDRVADADDRSAGFGDPGRQEGRSDAGADTAAAWGICIKAVASGRWSVASESPARKSGAFCLRRSWHAASIAIPPKNCVVLAEPSHRARMPEPPGKIKVGVLTLTMRRDLPHCLASDIGGG